MAGMRQHLLRLPVLIFAAALFSACQQLGAPFDAPELPATAESVTRRPVTAGSYYERALAGEFSGTVVTVSGPFGAEDAVKFIDSVAGFEESTGIDIQYTASREFESEVGGWVESGTITDIADFPQPGLLATFVESGKIVDVLEYLDLAYLEEQYDPSWLQMATMDSPQGPIMAGVWHRFNAKSLVWYPKAAFKAAGYEVPKTWDALVELADQMVADGRTPWCFGLMSGAATGWPATDWIEDIMLRTTSLENYDAWVRGELPFNSDELTHAAELMAELLLTEGHVYGGQAGMVSTFFGDAPLPMFEDPPGCWLHRQATFITGFFPPQAQAGVDYDFFYLPPIDEAFGRPFLVGGDIMAQFNDRPEVRAVMEYFTKGEALKGWLEAGGVLSPHRDARLEWYTNDMDKGLATLAAEATSFRFDGSDMMPGEVGAGSFWAAMTDFLSGAITLEEALAEIDASWPE